MKKLLLALVFLTILSTQVFAVGCATATRFWVGGTGNWSSTAHWSTTTGGTSGSAIPSTSDDVCFDTNSTGTATIDQAFTINSLDFSGVGGVLPFAGTLTASSSMTIAGNLVKYVTGMTVTSEANTKTWTFTSTSGTVLVTSAGKCFPFIIVNGAGGTVQLQDDWTGCPTSIIAGLTITAGTFDANNHNVTIGEMTASSASTSALLMGSGTWTMNNTGSTSNYWNSVGTGLTLTASTSTLCFCSTGVAGTVKGVAIGPSRTFNIITVNQNGGTLDNVFTFGAITTAMTIGTLNITAPMSVEFGSSAPVTITNAVAWAGTASNNVITVQGRGAATPTLTLASGSTCAWCAIGGLTFSGSTLTATNSFDLKGNSGTISISGPSGGGSGHIIGG